MTTYAFGVLALVVVTATACAIPGAFLVTSRQSMLVDAMGHAVLPGIVLAAMIWPIGSPLLVVGAALLALVVVAGAEAASRTGLVAGDASVGLLFPGLFSIGVILLSTRFSHLHLHEDTVLVGDPNIVAAQRLTWNGWDLGARYCYVMLGVLLLNALFFGLFHRKLALAVFDADYARTIGVRVGVLRSVAMTLVAVTLTASFYTAGAVLVIAFVVVPAATACLVANSFPRVIAFSAVIAAVVSTSAFLVTYWANRPTSSWTAFIYGTMFLAVWAGVRLRRSMRHRGRRRVGAEL
ncbi:MAG: metal ABC transporter permease [Actinomycetaceae bacterium]|nr:metal ABC transporter permease [Actinomycetaceae bacterium]